MELLDRLTYLHQNREQLPCSPGPVTTRLSDAYWAVHDEPQYRDPVDYC